MWSPLAKLFTSADDTVIDMEDEQRTFRARWRGSVNEEEVLRKTIKRAWWDMGAGVVGHDWELFAGVQRVKVFGFAHVGSGLTSCTTARIKPPIRKWRSGMTRVPQRKVMSRSNIGGSCPVLLLSA